VGDRDINDLRQNDSTPNPFPPPYYNRFLNDPAVKERIGAESNYTSCSNRVSSNFALTGDVSFFQLLKSYRMVLIVLSYVGREDAPPRIGCSCRREDEDSDMGMWTLHTFAKYDD